MNKPHNKLAIAYIIAIIGLAVFTSATHGQEISPSPAFTAKQLSVPAEEGWITNGGTLSNQRYSPLNQINRDNVATLKGVWRAGLNSGLETRNNNQAQPMIYEGVVYIATGQDDVFAISVDTGEILWSYKSGLNGDEAVICCGWVNRGVGMGEGKIFVGQVDAQLLALDQETGEVLWSIQGEDPKIGYSLTAAPLYYDGMVIIGYAGADMGTRGRIKAYDAKDGSEIWTFYTIPGPGEIGHDTWPQDSEIWKLGGASIWHTPALDPELGMLYFSTGNAAPVLGAGVRDGDNLFTASIVAIDVKTGEYRWHFQEVHHDIWDYDAPNPIILFDAKYDNQKRKGLAQAGKTGWIYILDRITGEPLIGIEEKPVPQEPRQATAKTQPYPVGDSFVPQYIDVPLEDWDLINEGRIFTPFYDKPIVYKPQAAANWPPSSYDPDTNYMFVCANDVANAARVDDSKGTDPTFDEQFLRGAYVGTSGQRRGILSAMDLKTNRIAWQRQFNDGCRSGSLATGGGLVFIGRNDGRVQALDSRDGKKLWEFRTEAPVNTAVSTFMHKGDQYIATYAGGSMFTNKSDGVWLFSLKGVLNEIPAPTGGFSLGPAAAAIAIPEGRTADVSNGRQVYKQSCVYCHGDSGAGGHGGGAELTSALKIADIFTVLTNGRNGMPNFSAVLTAEQVHDVSTYLTKELLAQ